MRAVVEAAIPIFIEHSTADDSSLISGLVASGCDQTTASRLVEFMPLGFTRVMLADSGVKFSQTFVRVQTDGEYSAEILLSDEPVFVAATSVAQAGVVREEMIAVAGRSAEFHAINEALYKGSQLSNLVCSPPVLMWGESVMPSQRRRRWWQVWRRND